jgi:hypothetical protein
VSRNAVRDSLRSDVPPRYERTLTGSMVDAVEPQIRELLREFPTMPATVIAERIGWERITILRDRVAELRPLFVPPDPCQRTTYAPGELAQSDLWQPDVENRIHGTTRRRPAEAIYEDRGSMMGFPPVLPDPSWRFAMRLPRGHYVRVDTNDYSVNPRFVGRRVDVRVTLDEVVATCDGTEVARHRRCLAKHQTLLQPEHARVLRAMRAEARLASTLVDEVEERDLAVYDRALGVA